MEHLEIEKATLAGGCFWCLEAVFSELVGVNYVISGYSGGHKENPSYEDVCSGKTGHAEVVQIQFNPKIIGFNELLEVFFTIHDPTTLNYQGNDVGTQYRSAIFYHSDQQHQVAIKVIRVAQENWDAKIVTELTEFDKFYPAEENHQKYFKKHPNQGYCAAIITPKIAKFRKAWQHKIKI